VTAALYVFVALLGLAIGSFLNVVIYRVPRHLSIVSPPSACPNCHRELTALDNIPLVSWIVLRGRCRYCRHPISVQYPLVELSTAVLFVGVLIRLGRVWAVPAYCVLMAGLLALAWIDAEHHRLPTRMVWILLVVVGVLLVVASGTEDNWHKLAVGAVCSLAWGLIFGAIHFSSPRLLGLGDVRLCLVLGLALGWLGVGQAFLGFFLANVIGLAVTLVLIALKKVNRNAPLPYGVYLAAGTAVAFYFGEFLLKPFQVN